MYTMVSTKIAHYYRVVQKMIPVLILRNFRKCVQILTVFIVTKRNV